MATTLQEIIQRRQELNAEYKRKNQEWRDFHSAAQRELTALAHKEAMVVGGLDLGRIEAGREVIYVRGELTKPVTNQSCRPEAVKDAMEDIAGGCKQIRDREFGVKNYSGFGDQREDHRYGYGPKHGTTVFSIGLTRDARNHINDGGELAPYQIEAALYLLASLHKIEEARAEAA